MISRFRLMRIPLYRAGNNGEGSVDIITLPLPHLMYKAMTHWVEGIGTFNCWHGECCELSHGQYGITRGKSRASTIVAVWNKGTFTLKAWSFSRDRMRQLIRISNENMGKPMDLIVKTLDSEMQVLDIKHEVLSIEPQQRQSLIDKASKYVEEAVKMVGADISLQELIEHIKGDKYIMELKEMRRILRLSQMDLAERIGCSISTLRLWERLLPKNMKPEYADIISDLMAEAELIKMAEQKGE